MDSPYLLSLILAAGMVWLVTKLLSIGKREHYLPPGPPTVPILGNALMVPGELPQFKFAEWAREYGGIYSLKMPNRTVIVVSDVTVLKELLDQRSTETSGRPPQYLFNLMTGGNYLIDKNPSTDIWRLGRKAIQSLLSRKAVTNHQPVIIAETAQLLYDLLCSPKDFSKHVGRYNYSLMLSITFGKRCPPFYAKETPDFFEALKLSAKLVSEAPPLDDIPILKYVPKWWAPWKVAYRQVLAIQRRLYFGLLEEVEARVAKGENTDYFMDGVIQHREELGMTRDAAAYLGAIILEAGSESATSFLRTLILCFTAFPEKLRMAQDEVDSLLPDGRPPTMDDIASLPYIRAVQREVQRFRPVPPLGFPHLVLKTQEYRGYIIPEGTTVVINSWGIMHNPDYFDEPEDFRPERFLSSEHGIKPGVDDKDWRTSILFGSGKRFCPGMYLAIANLTYSVAMLVWAFDIAPAIDPATKLPIPVDIKAYNSGLAFDPRPFSCSITPRSEVKAKAVKQNFADAVAALSKYELFLPEEEKRLLAEERLNM